MLSFDYIVVGGGSAGCTLANRLSKCGRYSVALLEAGGSHRTPLVNIPMGIFFTVPKDGRHNWSFHTVPQEGLNGRLGYQPRGKVLGGSSSINGMIYIRGAKEDYDQWEAMGNPGWAYNDVLPYFKKSQHHTEGANEFHVTGGELFVSRPRSPGSLNNVFIKAGLECGLPYNEDFNGSSQEGVGYYELTQQEGRRSSTAHAFLDEVRQRKNLTIFTHAFVQKVEVDGSRASGVSVKIKGKQQSIRANKEVILSAGAFQSPQLLLLSGIGAREKIEPHGIKHVCDLPGVGENLQDHLDYSLIYQSDSKDVFGFNFRSAFNLLRDSFKYWRKRRGVLTSNFNEAGAFYSADPSESSPGVQLHFAPTIVDGHGSRRYYRGGYTCHVCILRPKSRGDVQLMDSNPDSPPRIDPGFLQDERDLYSLLRGVRKAQQIMHSPAFNGIRGKALYASGSNDDDELIADIRSRADSIYHPVGTCKMGPDTDPLSVVDSSLRVKGVHGLRVIDASIMPSLISGNTNAPSIMIAEKGADLVLRQAGNV